MTPEQKIITIAEWEGWSGISHSRGMPPYCLHSYGVGAPLLPPYLTSRDAICGAVARLGDAEFAMWIEHLKDILHCGSWEFDCLTIEEKKNMFLATPDQLADALLLTLGHEI